MKKSQLKVRHFSKEDKRQYKENFPIFEPKPLEWALVDAKNGAVIDFFGTQKEAKAVLDELNQAFMVGDNFRDWVSNTARNLGVEEQKVLDAVQAYL